MTHQGGYARAGHLDARAGAAAAARAAVLVAGRVLQLSRTNGFHLYDLLHAQQSLSVLVFARWKVNGHHETG